MSALGTMTIMICPHRYLERVPTTSDQDLEIGFLDLERPTVTQFEKNSHELQLQIWTLVARNF